MPRSSARARTTPLAGAFSGALTAALLACSPIERTDAPPQAARVDLSGKIDVPPILQGTIASETILDGFQPVVVHGYGLVVGLEGTGSSDIPPDVRAHMIMMAARHGIGSASSGWGGLSPEALLDSPDTAVVVVEGIVPPAAPEGTRFDVRVFAYPTSSTTSLEGGRMYTTELVPVSRPDLGRRLLPPSGSRQPAAIASAAGPIFINPFADPAAVGRDTIDRRTGIILNGGQATRDLPLKLRLITPSHARASLIQSALNTRFNQEPGQRNATARGESGESIVITVPPSYHNATDDFVELVRHTTIRQAGTERVAATIRRYVLENPATARAASWRWEALGPRCLPVIRDLYTVPPELPRLAALRVGASLDDPLVTPHLVAMAINGSPDSRLQAIKLLGDMGLDPRIDEALHELVNDEDVETRLEAYEAMVKRRDPYVQRFTVDRKFVVDVVASDQPLIYITQLGLPRITIFGEDLTVSVPTTVTAWSRQVMIKSDLGDPQLEVYYRPPDALQGSAYLVSPQLPELVAFLGHTTVADNPLPGLGFSYSQVVGVLHQIWRQGYLKADFRPEQDRILAAIIRQTRRGLVTERPEFDTEVGLPEATPAGEEPFLESGTEPVGPDSPGF